MSAIPNVASLLGKNFNKLSGPKNFTTWTKDFKPIAILNGVWKLYEGTDPVLAKPDLRDTVPAAAGRPKRQTADAAIAAQAVVAEPPKDYSYAIAIYNVQLAEWKENEKAVRFALALL